MRAICRIAVIATMGGVTVAAPPGAAGATLSPGLVYEAAPGERNELVVGPVRVGFLSLFAVRITDPGARLITLDPRLLTTCVPLGLNDVACHPLKGHGFLDDESFDVTAHLGDGDDTAQVTGGYVSPHFHGGPGDDVLRSGGFSFSSLMDGGAGDDVLHDSASAGEALRGGAGDDHLVTVDDGWEDSLSCGEGTDTASLFLPDALPADCESSTVTP